MQYTKKAKISQKVAKGYIVRSTGMTLRKAEFLRENFLMVTGDRQGHNLPREMIDGPHAYPRE